jgi:hypothetical protein
MPTTIRLRSLPELITSLPYHLGFHPTGSVVLVCLAGGRLGAVARLDIPPRGEESQAAAAMLVPVVREPPDGVLLIGYDERPGQSRRLIRALVRRLRLLGYPDVDAVVVHEGMWRRAAARSEEPWGVLPQEADVPAVAEFVALESAPVADREGLTLAVTPYAGMDDDRRAALVQAVRSRRALVGEELRERRRAELEAWMTWQSDALSRPGTTPGDDELVVLVTALDDVLVRDAVIAWLCPGALPLTCFDEDLRDDISARLIQIVPDESAHEGPGADHLGVVMSARVGAALETLCRSTPAPWSVAVLTVTGAYRWWRGDGARARVALDLALSTDPQYRLACLLAMLVDGAVRPSDCA